MAGVVTVTILNNGKELAPKYEVLSIDVAHLVNRISYAQIVLIDGNAATQAFPLSESSFFKPGQSIEIKLHYEEKTVNKGDTVFKGLVVQHGIQARPQQSLLTIELKDAAIALTTQRKNVVFSNGKKKIKDSDIIKKVLTQAPAKTVTAGSIASTKTDHTEMVQFACTDWDFILSRAEANGQWVWVEAGKLSTTSPDLSASPKHSFEYGISDIYEIEMDADIQCQHGNVQGTAWDVDSQKLLSPKKAKPFTLAQSNLSPKKLANTIGSKQHEMVTSSPLTEPEVQAWADAQMLKSRLSLMRGRLQVPGFADIHLGDVMKLAGIGKRFSGKTLVTGIRHQIDEQGWTTDIQFGLSADWFAHTAEVTAPPAAGLLPAINGLQIGVVDKYAEDPDKQLRVRVKIPTLADSSEGLVWARLAAVGGGLERGIFFRPEPNDEVILGFLNDDPRQAIILGAVHSSKNKPPWEITEKNDQQGMVTKKKLTLSFNDEDDKESIAIKTPGGNEITLTDEKDKGIEIVDMNKNSIVMSSQGIEIVDMNKNSLVMSSQGIEIKSAKDLKLEGKNIILKGDKVDVK